MNELILQYRAGGRGRDEAYLKLYNQYEKLLMGILIKGGVSNVNIKDTVEYGEALVAFIDAITRFNLNSGIAFSTFVTHHVRLIMRRHYSSYTCGVNRFAEDFNEYCDKDEDDWAPAIDEDEGKEAAYSYCDRMDKADEDLNARFKPAIAFALKALSGLAGFSKLGKIQIFKLVGTQYRDELADIVLTLGLENITEKDTYEEELLEDDNSCSSSFSEVMTAAVPAL